MALFISLKCLNIAFHLEFTPYLSAGWVTKELFNSNGLIPISFFFYFLFFFFFYFWPNPYPEHIEVPRPGTGSEAQLQPIPQLQQHQILHLLYHSRNSLIPISIYVLNSSQHERIIEMGKWDLVPRVTGELCSMKFSKRGKLFIC